METETEKQFSVSNVFVCLFLNKVDYFLYSLTFAASKFSSYLFCAY